MIIILIAIHGQDFVLNSSEDRSRLMLLTFLLATLVVEWMFVGDLRSGKEQVTAVKREDRPRCGTSNLTSTSSLQPHILPPGLRNTTCSWNRSDGLLQMSILRDLFLSLLMPTDRDSRVYTVTIDCPRSTWPLGCRTTSTWCMLFSR